MLFSAKYDIIKNEGFNPKIAQGVKKRMDKLIEPYNLPVLEEAYKEYAMECEAALRLKKPLIKSPTAAPSTQLIAE